MCVGAGTGRNETCNVQGWVDRYGCANASAAPWPPRGPFSSARWSACPGGAVVELVTHDGGSHEIPAYPEFNATAYIAEWFLEGPGSA